MKFINREQELNALERFWEDKESQLIVIYGKRRVGKTELIKHFMHGFHPDHRLQPTPQTDAGYKHGHACYPRYLLQQHQHERFQFSQLNYPPALSNISKRSCKALHL